MMVSYSGDLDWKIHLAISRALCSIWLWYLEYSGLSPTYCDLQGQWSQSSGTWSSSCWSRQWGQGQGGPFKQSLRIVLSPGTKLERMRLTWTFPSRLFLFSSTVYDRRKYFLSKVKTSEERRVCSGLWKVGKSVELGVWQTWLRSQIRYLPAVWASFLVPVFSHEKWG